jgi:hypothetical protein
MSPSRNETKWASAMLDVWREEGVRTLKWDLADFWKRSESRVGSKTTKARLSSFLSTFSRHHFTAPNVSRCPQAFKSILLLLVNRWWGLPVIFRHVDDIYCYSAVCGFLFSFPAILESYIFRFTSCWGQLLLVLSVWLLGIRAGRWSISRGGQATFELRVTGC